MSRQHQHQDVETIARRLSDGYIKIEEAKTRGEDVQSWEDFWIELLRQYEQNCDDDGGGWWDDYPRRGNTP